MIRLKRAANALSLVRPFGQGQRTIAALVRRNRSGCGYELYRDRDGSGFLNVYWGSRTHHAWWAMSIYVYFR